MLRHLSVPYRNFTATAQDARWLPAVCEFDEAKLGLEIAHGREISIPALNGGASPKLPIPLNLLPIPARILFLHLPVSALCTVKGGF